MPIQIKRAISKSSMFTFLPTGPPDKEQKSPNKSRKEKSVKNKENRPWRTLYLDFDKQALS